MQQQGEAMETMQTRELISALADGQLQGEGFALGVRAATIDGESLAVWREYHLIGDVLRSDDLAGASCGGDAFLQRLQQRLAAEAPLRPELPVAAPATVAAQEQVSANDSLGRWKVAAGLASLAAVAALGWGWVGNGAGGPAAQSQLAAAQHTAVPTAAVETVVARESANGTMMRDPRLDQLLAAHRQFGGSLALQAPAGALRTAAFEAPAR